ncbi:tyrosine-type recombinase/integrase [Chitinimonas arctica]|nr:site-specific integrase [Chitinimonas arctica]
MPLHEIRGGMALEIVHQLDVSNARKNKYLAVLRALLRRAERAWEWIDKAPNFTMLPEPKRRIRSLTKEQALALVDELPEHQQRMVIFALATGLRQGNVLGLTWGRIDLDRRVAYIDGDDFKNGDDHGVPLNDSAVDIVRQCIGNHPTHVFTYRGKPIKQANTKAWRNALERAGIVAFRWHDLRHAVATWLVQDGTPLFAVQEFFGWKDGKMVRRYAHLAPQHLAQYAAGLDTRLRRDSARG